MENKKKMDEIIKKIIEWGNEKGINNPDKQFNKLAEEMLEAHEAYLEKKFHRRHKTAITVITEFYPRHLDKHLKEELGDICVVWILLCNMLGISPLEALEIAHKKNKDRKGKTINGNFIKEDDL